MLHDQLVQIHKEQPQLTAKQMSEIVGCTRGQVYHWRVRVGYRVKPVEKKRAHLNAQQKRFLLANPEVNAFYRSLLKTHGSNVAVRYAEQASNKHREELKCLHS